MNSQETIKNLEQRLIRQEQLASIGQMTAGILHELRNPLNFVNNFSKLSVDLAEELDDIISEHKTKYVSENFDEMQEVFDLLKQNIQKIKEHGLRAERLITGMLATTRDVGGKFEPSDLNTLVEENVKLAYHALRGENPNFNAVIQFFTDKQIGTVDLIPQEFCRVILNIAGNGFYALNEKLKNQKFQATLTVSTSKTEQNIVISIHDNGIGIEPEIIDKIFKAFFSTKPVNKGTGLGLSMSFDIIKNQHHGEINVKSEPGMFTEFTIIIPLNLKN